ncbi:uric acid degradation bifunctional protein TTL-like [Arachis duranensis]|uniref:2-oxo-4-hydroxy-4-carboxy-5-ureidoimidazoline decarboxylase n=1 Tax=Arachis duranensis TaxID=130453 RepID=A0A6P4D459_ARADU|nr:uric acid degradation bifunctional protein TTL-like [Arachis duranensis]
MQEASPFSSLEHGISFARDLWFNNSSIRAWLGAFSAHRHIGTAISRAPTELISDLCQFGAKYRKKFGFEFVTITDARHSHKIMEEVKARCENNLLVELEFAAREEFYFIERRLTKLWERLSQEEFQEETEDLGEIVPDSLEEELMPSNSSDEVFWTGDKATMRSYDLNKTPDENQIE